MEEIYWAFDDIEVIIFKTTRANEGHMNTECLMILRELFFFLDMIIL